MQRLTRLRVAVQLRPRRELRRDRAQRALQRHALRRVAGRRLRRRLRAPQPELERNLRAAPGRKGREAGKEPEPRAGIKQGHIPGSINLPYDKLYKNNSTKLSSPSYIMSALNEGGIDPKKPIISSCGSGVTASVLFFYLKAMGYDTVSIYDGSWTEWGSRSDTKISSEVK